MDIAKTFELGDLIEVSCETGRQWVWWHVDPKYQTQPVLTIWGRGANKNHYEASAQQKLFGMLIASAQGYFGPNNRYVTRILSPEYGDIIGQVAPSEVTRFIGNSEKNSWPQDH